jgi:hypothetical protein
MQSTTGRRWAAPSLRSGHALSHAEGACDRAHRSRRLKQTMVSAHAGCDRCRGNLAAGIRNFETLSDYLGLNDQLRLPVMPLENCIHPTVAQRNARAGWRKDRESGSSGPRGQSYRRARVCKGAAWKHRASVTTCVPAGLDSPCARRCPDPVVGTEESLRRG